MVKGVRNLLKPSCGCIELCSIHREYGLFCGPASMRACKLLGGMKALFTNTDRVPGALCIQWALLG